MNLSRSLASGRLLILNLARGPWASGRTLATEVKKEEKEGESTAIPTDIVPEYEEKLQREEQFRELIEAKRDVSRFSKKTAQNKYEKQVPLIGEKHFSYDSQRAYRKIYARFGAESGVDPAICWPSHRELQEMTHFENSVEMSLGGKIRKVAKQVENNAYHFNKRITTVKANLEKQPKLVEEFYQKVAKKDKIEQERLKKKEELLERAREYYGYDIDARDPKVQLMLQKLEAEKKSEEKKRKEEEKKKRLNV